MMRSKFDEQLDRFMKRIRQDERWYDFFYTELTTGLRRGELCGLKWEDFDAENGKLKVRRSVAKRKGGGLNIGETKTETGTRTIVLPPSTAELLRKRKETADSENEAYRIYREIICDNIEYDILLQDKRIDRDRLDEIVDIILETVCSSRKKIRIAGDDYPAELVKSKFMKLNSSHIEFVFDCLRENTTKIRNIRQYLRAVLFNAPSTIDSYYTALVAHDMAQPDWGKPKSGIPDYSYEGADSL